jgi:hypothetical protein
MSRTRSSLAAHLAGIEQTWSALCRMEGRPSKGPPHVHKTLSNDVRNHLAPLSGAAEAPIERRSVSLHRPLALRTGQTIPKLDPSLAKTPTKPLPLPFPTTTTSSAMDSSSSAKRDHPARSRSSSLLLPAPPFSRRASVTSTLSGVFAAGEGSLGTASARSLSPSDRGGTPHDGQATPAPSFVTAAPSTSAQATPVLLIVDAEDEDRLSPPPLAPGQGHPVVSLRTVRAETEVRIVEALGVAQSVREERHAAIRSSSRYSWAARGEEEVASSPEPQPRPWTPFPTPSAPAPPLLRARVSTPIPPPEQSMALSVAARAADIARSALLEARMRARRGVAGASGGGTGEEAGRAGDGAA